MCRLLKLLAIIAISLTVLHCTDRAIPPKHGDLADEASDTQASAEKLKYYDESLLARRELARFDNEFGFRVFQEITRSQPDSNVFISPLSISMALGMTANGAAGSTLDAMLYTLNLDGYPVWLVNACYRSLIDNLGWLDPKVQFEIANSVWCNDEVFVEEPFLDACETYFDAQVQSVDFTDPGTPETINDWVNRHTHGKIPTIVDGPINPAMVVMLLNAMYFLGTWSHEFDPGETDDDWFEQPDGSWAPCRMMERPGPKPGFDAPGCKYAYLNYEEFKGVDLAYGDSLFSMTVLLPEPWIHVDSLISMLSQEAWDEWMDSFCTGYTYGRVLMPRFELEFKYLMNDVLDALGMGIALDPAQADFSRICRYLPLWIGRVIHKTYVRVDEAGTEAAAVTEVDLPTGILPCPAYFELYVNRPFVFVIRENRWGTILFLGKVVDPGYFD